MAFALASDIKPEIFDGFLITNNLHNKVFTEFGGVISPSSGGFIPTVKTALFLLGGHTFGEQMKFVDLFQMGSVLYRDNILADIKTAEGDPVVNKLLSLSETALNHLMNGEAVAYEYSPDFPASRLATELAWEDLVLCETTARGLKELLAWPEYGGKLIEELNMNRNIQPGYRALFYGPSGTGKTLTAALLGKRTGKPVYRVDISQMVSKYIGETQKNLEKIFRIAEERDWILFFDEADALFGKRTNVANSNDRAANMETAYLLQRIEVCTNIVILASNLKKNLDEAFTRRFQSIVSFPVPESAQRQRLWEGVFTDDVVLDEEIDFSSLAAAYDLSGGAIVNVARYATLMALSNDTVFISKESILEGVRREYAKQGKTM